MKTFFTQRIYLALACVTLLSACSRPVAYFQHTVAVPATSHQTQPLSDVSSLETSSTITTDSDLPSHINFSQFETYVRNDARLANSKRLQTRVERLKHLLSESVAEKTRNVISVPTTKMKAVEHLMIKKVNTKIRKHLSPSQPEKAMVNRGLLSGGAILFIGGLLLLLLTTGTGAVIGLIALLMGILALLLGLLAS